MHKKISNILIRSLWIICAIATVIIGIFVKKNFPIIPTVAIILIAFFIVCVFLFLALVGDEFFTNSNINNNDEE